MANHDLQVSALTATYRLLLRENDITRAQLKAKLIEAQTAMEGGTEINSISFEGGAFSGSVLYPREVVLAAALAVLEESADDSPTKDFTGDRSVTHADLSCTRIET